MTATAAVGTKQRSGRGLRGRHLWLVPGLAIEIAANELGEANGVGILALLALGIAPDLPRLLGAAGRSAHNVLHEPLAAAGATGVAAGLTVAGVVPLSWLVAALVWLGHVVAGWGVGDVPRHEARVP